MSTIVEGEAQIQIGSGATAPFETMQVVLKDDDFVYYFKKDGSPSKTQSFQLRPGDKVIREGPELLTIQSQRVKKQVLTMRAKRPSQEEWIRILQKHIDDLTEKFEKSEASRRANNAKKGEDRMAVARAEMAAMRAKDSVSPTSSAASTPARAGTPSRKTPSRMDPSPILPPKEKAPLKPLPDFDSPSARDKKKEATSTKPLPSFEPPPPRSPKSSSSEKEKKPSSSFETLSPKSPEEKKEKKEKEEKKTPPRTPPTPATPVVAATPEDKKKSKAGLDARRQQVLQEARAGVASMGKEKLKKEGGDIRSESPASARPSPAPAPVAAASSPAEKAPSDRTWRESVTSTPPKAPTNATRTEEPKPARAEPKSTTSLQEEWKEVEKKTEAKKSLRDPQDANTTAAPEPVQAEPEKPPAAAAAPPAASPSDAARDRAPSATAPATHFDAVSEAQQMQAIMQKRYHAGEEMYKDAVTYDKLPDIMAECIPKDVLEQERVTRENFDAILKKNCQGKTGGVLRGDFAVLYARSITEAQEEAHAAKIFSDTKLKAPASCITYEVLFTFCQKNQAGRLGPSFDKVLATAKDANERKEQCVSLLKRIKAEEHWAEEVAKEQFKKEYAAVMLEEADKAIATCKPSGGSPKMAEKAAGKGKPGCRGCNCVVS